MDFVPYNPVIMLYCNDRERACCGFQDGVWRYLPFFTPLVTLPPLLGKLEGVRVRRSA